MIFASLISYGVLTFQLVAGSKDHIKVQGEILEGVVARIVSRDSSNHMEEVLREFPPPPMDGSKPLNSLCQSLVCKDHSFFFNEK